MPYFVLRGLQPQSSILGEHPRVGVVDLESMLQTSIGTQSEIRTHTLIKRLGLSQLCLPFHHSSIVWEVPRLSRILYKRALDLQVFTPSLVDPYIIGTDKRT